jgi:hypothetical protein
MFTSEHCGMKVNALSYASLKRRRKSLYIKWLFMYKNPRTLSVTSYGYPQNTHVIFISYLHKTRRYYKQRIQIHIPQVRDTQNILKSPATSLPSVWYPLNLNITCRNAIAKFNPRVRRESSRVRVLCSEMWCHILWYKLSVLSQEYVPPFSGLKN